MKDRYNIVLLSIIAIGLTLFFAVGSGMVDGNINAQDAGEYATGGDAVIASPGEADSDLIIEAEADGYIVEETEEKTGDGLEEDTDGSEVDSYTDDGIVAGETIPLYADRSRYVTNNQPNQSIVLAATAYPDYRPVGDKKPMTNNAAWWSEAKSYITSTFGVVDGQYNTVASAPPAGNVWCAGLVSRVINNTYPNGNKIAVTESVATLYNEIVSSGDFEFIAEGYVGDFVDVISSTKAGDIMLLMSKKSDGSWEWTHSNLITYYGYIYSQGAGGKIRMNTFDNYNQYGAYEASVSAGYYYYIYRAKSTSYLGIRKTGKLSGSAYNNVWFEAYDENGTFLGAYLTGAANEEKGGYAYYLRKSTSDLAYVESDGGVPLPEGSTVYLYEQGVKNGSSFSLPSGASGYAGTKGGTWSYVKGPQKQYYITLKTVSYDNWTAANAFRVEEPESVTYGPISLQKICQPEYSLYTQDTSRYSLAGARYTIASEDNSLVYYMETDSTGTAYLLDGSGNRTNDSTIDSLPEGKYYCWETKASKGYKIDSNCNVNNKKSVTLNSSNTFGTFTSNEVPEVSLRGGIQLIKRSSDGYSAGNNNYNLSAEYTVYNSSGTSVGKITTSEQGTGYIGGLPAGSYTVKETKAGKGYELDPSVYAVTVSAPTVGKYVYNGVDYTAVFNPSYYKNNYSDLAGMSQSELLKHFAETGLKQGRRACVWYDGSFYSKKKGLSYYEAFKYYIGYGMYKNEKASPDDMLNGSDNSGVYQAKTLKPIVISYETPKSYKRGLTIEKRDKYTGSFTIEGDSTLAGAEYKIEYYSAESIAAAKNKDPDRTWIINTIIDDDGKSVAKLNDKYLSEAYSQSELYKDASGNVIIPFGVIRIEEIKAPTGYKLDEVRYEEGDNSWTEPFYIFLNQNDTFSGTINAYEEVIRGDIKLTKCSFPDGEPMEGVEFEVRYNATGESLIITTDESGYATTSGMWLNGTPDGSVVEIQEGKGALPYGEYTVTELRCDANQGRQLEPPIVINIEDEMIYDIYDPSKNEPIISNVPMPEIGTTLHIQDSDTDVLNINEKQTLIDTVAYEYLKADTEYTLLGKLMIRDKDGNVEEYKRDGEAFSSVTHFKTEPDYEVSVFEKQGSVDVLFDDINVDGLEGKSLVVYEYLYLGDTTDENSEYPGYEEEDIFPVMHEDKDDENQTLHIIRIGTQAHGEQSDSKVILKEDSTTIVDTISYENVVIGEKYTVEGTLYDKKTAAPLLVDGKEVTGETEFVAEETSGEIEVTFVFNSIGKDITDVVVFENMLDVNGKLVAEHEDIDDEGQTVKIEEKVNDKDKDKKDKVVESETKDDNSNTDDSDHVETTVDTVDDNPKTGDRTLLIEVIIGFALSGLGLLYLLMKMRRKDSK